jgi:hypothetical protein
MSNIVKADNSCALQISSDFSLATSSFPLPTPLRAESNTCPPILGQSADRAGRRGDRCFSISFNGRKEDARRTVADYGCNCVRFYFWDDQIYQIHRNKRRIVHLGPKTKPWRGVYREKTVIASNSLVTIKGAIFLQVTSQFYSPCTYYMHML